MKKTLLEMVMEDAAKRPPRKVKSSAPHVATEYMKSHGADEAMNLCRQLFPHLRDRVMYPVKKEPVRG